VAANRKAVITKLIDEVRRFPLRASMDDSEEQTAVASGYRSLIIKLQGLVSTILAEAAALRLKAVDVDVNDFQSAIDAEAAVYALLPDIEEALALFDESAVTAGTSQIIVDPALIMRLAEIKSPRFDVAFLVRVCREINSSYAHGNVLATALLMRLVLNHVPPIFGYQNFEQVVSNIGRSLKESFDHLENGLRKIADFHTHRVIKESEVYPSVAQVTPFSPQFELLLQQVEARLKKA
jgi:hypothetical protein